MLLYEAGNYVDNLISNNAIEQEEMTNLQALHFRDISRNREIITNGKISIVRNIFSISLICSESISG